ncbi:MAG: hypothetical protein ABIM30_04200 [candidate division WOR-3 bacterium]
MLTFIINFMFWFVIMFFSGIIVHFLPASIYDEDNLIFKPKPWEFDGRLYTTIFGIKKWKDKVPECGEFFKFNPFNKKKLAKGKDIAYIQRFILETCRAELTHLIPILMYPVSLLWNDYPASLYVLIFILLTNFPFLIIQRYNRIRLMRVLRELQREAEVTA